MRKLMMAALFALPMFGATAIAQDTLKIGWIDPLSGGAASNGERALKLFQFLANELNAKGGVLGKHSNPAAFGSIASPASKASTASSGRPETARYWPWM
jgi:branched-chain amino acid transport system substrate-binding protein